MPRANRYFVPGNLYHLTHRCHYREFLFRFARDRNACRQAWSNPQTPSARAERRARDVPNQWFEAVNRHAELLLRWSATIASPARYLQDGLQALRVQGKHPG